MIGLICIVVVIAGASWLAWNRLDGLAHADQATAVRGTIPSDPGL